MSLLLIWIWIYGNCESCPQLTCPLTPQAAFTNIIGTSFHSFQPLSAFYFLLPPSKSTYIMGICTKSASALQLWWLYVSDNALTTPLYLVFCTMSLCLTKQSVIHSWYVPWYEHMEFIETLLSPPQGLKCGADLASSVQPSREKTVPLFLCP